MLSKFKRFLKIQYFNSGFFKSVEYLPKTQEYVTMYNIIVYVGPFIERPIHHMQQAPSVTVNISHNQWRVLAPY